MPELPEVENYRKYVEGTSLDKPIVNVWIDDPRLTRPRGSAFSKKLKQNKFISTSRRGKYLFIGLENGGTLIMHFGLTGDLLYFNDKEDTPKFTRVLFQFSGGSYLAYICIRKFGWVAYEKDLKKYLENTNLGTDATLLTFEEFRDKISNRKAPVKTLLLDQSIAAGVGNWIADEILYQARVHPETKTVHLTKKEIRTLFTKLKKIIDIAIRTEGDNKKFPKYFLIHNREPGGKCYYTGVQLKRIVVGGRGSFISPALQKKK